ncbi:structural maintenance of chromosomes protein 3 [Nephila pilipes]|uniref:Structural maintenance of chromosomes protein 3 n=1 Tax=Nephila pilipes TaxID=299642 RepID=A0A8X6P5U0_NEPPI|nr:structural maintenance of chromosomes protein 3 [Nephila pilipes]
MTNGATINCRDNVRKDLQNFIKKGGSQAHFSNSYYGILIENFDYDKTIWKVVELVPGNKLFYQISENDKISIKIVQEMNREQLPGVLTFMPINILMYKEFLGTNDTISMINKINNET